MALLEPEKSKDGTHYYNECGCMYKVGEDKPWLVCPEHFAEQSRQKMTTAVKPKMPSLFLPPKLVGIDPAVRHYSLYALKLEHGKYYVGLTARKNPYVRIGQHGTKKGARWTSIHHPLEVLEIQDIGRMNKYQAEKLEHALTLEYMHRYGYRNVRGGRVVYTGPVIKIGSMFITGYMIWDILVVALLFVLGLYVIVHH